MAPEYRVIGKYLPSVFPFAFNDGGALVVFIMWSKALFHVNMVAEKTVSTGYAIEDSRISGFTASRSLMRPSLFQIVI